MNTQQTINAKVAGLNLKITCFHDKVLFDALEEYMTDEKNVDFCINITKTDSEIPFPEGKKLTKRSDDNWYILPDGKYVYIQDDVDSNSVMLKITYDIPSANAEIELYDLEKKFGKPANLFAFNAMGIAFRFLILWRNGFVVHSSSVVYDGFGIAFSAKSGTGKSTHTGLWLKNYPGTYILNDDIPALRYMDDEWYICGTPWAGTTGINKNSIVPLKALVFLTRSQTNQIRDCSAMEAIYHFFEAVIHPVSDEITTTILISLNLLLRKSRVCLLGCNMDDSAAETVRKYLFEKDDDEEISYDEIFD